MTTPPRTTARKTAVLMSSCNGRRSKMQAALRMIGSRWMLTAFGLVSAGIMLWLMGPFLSVLEGVLPRSIALLAMTFVWLGVNLVIDMVHRRADSRLTAGVTQGTTATGAPSPTGADDVAEQRDRLTRALNLLHK